MRDIALAIVASTAMVCMCFSSLFMGPLVIHTIAWGVLLVRVAKGAQ